MQLIEYIISNNTVKLCVIFFIIIVFIFTDLYDNRKYDLLNYNNNITNTHNINSTNNNINECNNSIDLIYYYKNINFILGIILILLSSVINKNTYTHTEIYRLKIYFFVYLFITYIYGFVILLNNYLYDCFNMIINSDSYNFYSFIVNYSVFIILGMFYILKSFCSNLLSCNCFVTRNQVYNPPQYKTIVYKLPSYDEISNDMLPQYNQQINQQSNNNHSNV
jgi:hypothetical protein